MGKLDGRVAFLTGAARGQGRSHAVMLAGEGADIIAVDSLRSYSTVPYPMATNEDLETTARAVENLGRKMVYGEVDVRDLSGLTEFVDGAVAALGRLDIVVANAGIHSAAPSLELSEEAWQDVIDVNLTGVWKTVKASVPKILDGNRGGSVIITSSAAAERALARHAHYCSAKGGLVMLMKVLALELAENAVRVNTVHPTTVLTDMVLNETMFRSFRPDLENPERKDWEEASRKMFKFPISGLDPEDVSRVVLFLASDDSRYVTGSTYYVDAGTRL